MPVAVTTPALAAYFARLGTIGFGGPVALVAEMRRELVEKRGWFTESDYARGLALAQLAPGPLAAQLAMYLGWVRGGALGATLCGATFVLPSFALVLAFSAFYVRAGDVTWLRPAFAGVGAALVCILVRAVWRLARGLRRADRSVIAVAVVNAVAVVVLRRESIVLLVASGALLALAPHVPRVSQVARALLAALIGAHASVAYASSAQHPAAADVSLLALFTFFTAAGAVVFGSGLAVMPFVYTALVEQRGWLTERQFLDAVAVAMVTPGPVIVLVVFVGYVLAGTGGAIVATLGVLGPALALVVALAPRLERVMRYATVRRFVDGVTAGATGALMGAAAIIAARSIGDVRGAALAVACALALSVWRTSRLADPLLLVSAAIVGVVAL